MKKLVISCSVLCMIVFTQCGKDVPISELIAQEEVNYENLDKVETIWKEGDEKVETSWEEGFEKELDLEFLGSSKEEPKIKRLSVWWEGHVAVIRLGPNCGDYPTIEFNMDCEDTGSQTHILNWDYYNNKTDKQSVAWLTQYGIQSVYGNLTMFFCVLPDAWDFPTSMIYYPDTWATVSLSGYAFYPTSMIGRNIDNEDSSNGNYQYAIMTNGTKILCKPKNPSYDAPEYGGLRQTPINSYFLFAPAVSSTGTKVFPNKGFNYAVFSKKPIPSNDYISYVAEVYSDDEDSSNANSWAEPAGSVPSNVDRDFGYIKGKANTTFYVTRAK